jgi:hypothetical protein
LNDLKDCFETYADEKLDEAITNFAGVIFQPGFDESTLPGGRKPNFKNFLLRWVDRFIHEAKPFITFRPKQGTSPPGKGPDWGGNVDSGKRSGSGPRSHRIAADNISPDDLDQYFN